MNQITDPPNEYDFGHDFSYALWTPNTQLTLCNVPWNADYRDIVRFETKFQLDTYLQSPANLSHTINAVSYVKPNTPVRIDLPFNTVLRYNYIRARNPLQPVTPVDEQRDYYYFIQDVRYVAPNTTEIIVQLDVWQTYFLDVQFGNCFVQQGHIGVANEKQFDAFGRDYLTVPEGLNIGGEYRIVEKRSEKIIDMSETVVTPTIVPGGQADGMEVTGSYDILVVATADFESSGVGVDGDPVLYTGASTQVGGIMSGATVYLFSNVTHFYSWLRSMGDRPWITQTIISITMIPKITRYKPDYVYTDDKEWQEPPNQRLGSLTHKMFPNWRDEVVNKLPVRYRHLKKFLTSPYTIIELTTYQGTPIILKPESWADKDASVVETIALYPSSQRVLFSPQRYNAQADSAIEQQGYTRTFPFDEGRPEEYVPLGDGDDGGEYFDLFTMIQSFPQLNILNNSALAFMASNKHSIAFSQQSADWSQQKALRGADTSYDQTQAGLNAARDQMRLQQNVNQQNTTLGLQTSGANAILGSVTGGVNSIAGGVSSGNPISAGAGVLNAVSGAVTTAASYGIQANHAKQSLDIQNNALRQSNQINRDLGQFVADTNRDLAQWAARGDYSNTIAGINARVQDAQLLQPSTSGQLAGEVFALVNDKYGVHMRVKMIDNAAIRTVGEYWLRYGYQVSQFTTPPSDLHCMSKFTYWKLLETYLIDTHIPEAYKSAIRGIFEKGVTVWKNPNDIGRIDIADNEPLTGITL